MNKTQKRNVQRWIQALRSGEYQQTRGQLNHPTEGYCCLGVLCELQGIPSRNTGSYVEYQFGDIFNSGGIPMDTFEKMTGFPDTIWGGDSTSPAGTRGMLIHANDHENLNFKEIADLLDIYLLENQ